MHAERYQRSRKDMKREKCFSNRYFYAKTMSAVGKRIFHFKQLTAIGIIQMLRVLEETFKAENLQSLTL